MKIKQVLIGSLYEDSDNARVHPDSNMAAIKASLERFGQRIPLVVKDDIIVAGNGRLRAMREMGWEKVWITRAEDLSDEQAREFSFADNWTSDLATWDPEQLADLLEGVDEDVLNSLQYDPKLINVSSHLRAAPSDVQQDPVPDPPKKAITKLGDLWKLGKHRVVCGDALLAKIPEGCAIITDPPYGIDWVPRTNHRGRDHVWKDDKVFDPGAWLGRGVYHLFWGAQYFASSLPISDDWLVWVKRPIDFDFSNDARTYATVELAWTDFGCKSRFMVHVWDGGMRSGHQQNRDFSHPAQKPIELVAWTLSKLPEPDLLVCDPFLGSGTTLIAAEQLDRVCYGVEIEPRYCDVVVERWQNLTGKKARRSSA